MPSSPKSLASRRLHGFERLENRHMLAGDPLYDPLEVESTVLRNLSAAEYWSEMSSRPGTQLLVDLEIEVVDGEQRFHTVWQQNSGGRNWVGLHGQPQTQFEETNLNLRNAGYRLLNQENFVVGDTRYWAGVWKLNPEQLDWQSLRNLSRTNFNNYLTAYSANHILTDFEAYQIGESTYYAAVYVENVDNLSWVVRYDLTAGEFASYRSQYDADYRITDFESYQVDGEQRYAAIWVHNTNGRQWAMQHDLSEIAFENNNIRMNDLGYRLVDFESYPTTTGVQYAGVWRQNSDRPDWNQRVPVDNLVQLFSDGYNLPGLSVAIAHRGEIKYMRGFGHQDIAVDQWYSASTVNRLASVSKAIAGVLVMQLAEQRIMNYTMPTRYYVPEMPVHHTHTLEQLVSNRSGVGHYYEHGLLDMYDQYDTAREAAELFWDDALVAAPGTKYIYSTHGYTLLGAAIEGATGKPIAQVIDEQITRGLNLPSLQAENRSQPDPFRANIYDNSQTELLPDNISWKILGGGLEASAYDLAKFSSELMAGSILSSRSLEKMWTVPEPATTSYGMGWDIGTQQGARMVGKGGGQPGASTYIRLFPEAELAVVVLVNYWGFPATTLASDIADIILPTIELLPGDHNKNGTVDGRDLLALQRNAHRPDAFASVLQDWQKNYGKSLAGNPAAVMDEADKIDHAVTMEPLGMVAESPGVPLEQVDSQPAFAADQIFAARHLAIQWREGTPVVNGSRSKSHQVAENNNLAVDVVFSNTSNLYMPPQPLRTGGQPRREPLRHVASEEPSFTTIIDSILDEDVAWRGVA